MGARCRRPVDIHWNKWPAPNADKQSGAKKLVEAGKRRDTQNRIESTENLRQFLLKTEDI